MTPKEAATEIIRYLEVNGWHDVVNQAVDGELSRLSVAFCRRVIELRDGVEPMADE